MWNQCMDFPEGPTTQYRSLNEGVDVPVRMIETLLAFLVFRGFDINS